MTPDTRVAVTIGDVLLGLAMMPAHPMTVMLEVGRKPTLIVVEKEMRR